MGWRMTIEVRLVKRYEGKLNDVATVRIPDMEAVPEVVIWDNRIFIRYDVPVRGSETWDVLPPVYREAEGCVAVRSGR